MTTWRRALVGILAGALLAGGLVLMTASTASAGSPSPAPGSWYVFILTNVASPGNIWIGQLSDLAARPDTCDWTDGGECPPNTPVTYTTPVGPVSCDAAVAAYQAQAKSPHAAFGGQKVYIFGNSYFIDNLDTANLGSLCANAAAGASAGASAGATGAASPGASPVPSVPQSPLPSGAALAVGGLSGQAPPTGGSTPGGGGAPILPIAGLVVLAAAGLGAVGYATRARVPSGAPGGDAPPAVKAGINLAPPSDIVNGTQVASVGSDRFGGYENTLSYGEGAGTAQPASEKAAASLVVAQAPAATRETPLVTAPALAEQTRVQPTAADQPSTPPRPRGPEDVLPEGTDRAR